MKANYDNSSAKNRFETNICAWSCSHRCSVPNVVGIYLAKNETSPTDLLVEDAWKKPTTTTKCLDLPKAVGKNTYSPKLPSKQIQVRVDFR